MYAIRVMPIARGVFKDELTFFSRDAFAPGVVVQVPVRGRKISGIVMSTTDAREDKMNIRSADFSLRKIESGGKRIFLESFIRAIKKTATWTGTHDGVATASLTSSVVLASLPKVTETPQFLEKHSSGVQTDVLVLQAEYEERVRTYRNLAREALARNASVLILVPTIIEAESLSQELARGIENSAVLVTGDLPKKNLVATWNRVVESKTPLVIVGTAFALSLPKADIDTIVVERESAKSYRALNRPFLDVRRAAEYVAKESGARLILADFPVRVETRNRIGKDAEEFARLQVRPQHHTEVSITDSRPKDSKRGEKRVFTTLAKETKEEITKEIKRGGRAVVFAARRGIAPLTVCNDCGTPVTDPDTGTPMVLHKTEKGNVFISHRSGAVLPSQISCSVCHSWNLVTLGIGVDRVYDELTKEFPDTEILLFTKDTTPTHAKAKKLSQNFFGKKGVIMVGTERMLPYLTAPVEIIVVASIDSMLSLPQWRAHEQTLSILYYLRERSENRLIIETREPEHAVMTSVTSGNPADFYREEVAERERYSYPPFSTFIGLTALGSQTEVENARALLRKTFADSDLVGPLPAEIVGKNEWRVRAVIRVPLGSWPDETLAMKLKELPPTILVAIDPDEIV